MKMEKYIFQHRVMLLTPLFFTTIVNEHIPFLDVALIAIQKKLLTHTPERIVQVRIKNFDISIKPI